MYDLRAFQRLKHRAGLWLVVAFLLGLVQVAHAVEWNSGKDFVWNATSGKITAFPGAGSGNVWSTASKGIGSTGPFASFPKALPFNPSPTANFKAGFTPAAMARALSPMSAITTLVGYAVIQKAVQEACLRLGGTVQSGLVWQECTYTSTEQWYSTFGNNPPPLGPWGSPAEGVAFGNTRLSGLLGTPTYVVSETRYSDTLYEACYKRSSGLGSTYCYQFTRGSGSVTPSGYKDSTPAVAEAKLSAKLSEWSQADFLYGRQNGDTVQVLDALILNGVPVDATVWSEWQTQNLNGQLQTLNPSDPSKVTINHPTETFTVRGFDSQGNPTTVSTTTKNSVSEYRTDQNGSGSPSTNINITQNTTSTTNNGPTTTVNNNTNNTTNTTTTNTGGTTPAGEVKTDCDKYPGSLGCAPASRLQDIINAINGVRDAIINKVFPAPVVNVPAPVVNVPAPVVNVQPPDLSPITSKLDELKNKPDAPTDCDKKPNSAGCADLGTPPSDEIPKRSIDLTYTPESHFGGGSCPSDKTMQIHGGPSVVIANWAPICDQVTSFVRPLLLVLAALGSLLVLAPGLREGTA